MEKWKLLETKTIFKNQWFDIKEEKVQITENMALDGIIVHHFSDWVNIVALTPDRQVLMERQYRHAIREYTIETPSGAMEPEDPDAEAAALRELKEETGYVPRRLVKLGCSQANPQLMNNHIHHFLALECEKTGEPELNLIEKVVVWKEPFEQVLEKIRTGRITQSYTVEGLFRADDWIRKNANAAVP